MLSRSLQKYFVYTVASSGFLMLNLVGSISVHVTGYRLLGYHYANTAIALSFVITYLILLRTKRQAGYIPLRKRFGNYAESDMFRRFVILLILLHLLSMALFFTLGAKPLVFRYDLFGDWAVLVQERIKIVQHPSFYWFSLGIFETPLFLTLLSTVLWLLPHSPSLPEQAMPWKRAALLIAAYSLLVSVIYLNKQYIIYLLAGMSLCHIVISNKISPAKFSIFSSASLFVLFILYKLYAGSVTVWSILQIITHRIFEVYAWAGAVAFHLYPDQIAFLQGASIVNPKGIFPYRQVVVADLIYPYIYGDIGYGNAPLPAIYENYVNFGWWGIAAGIVIVNASVVALTLLSWTKNLFGYVLSLFLTIKTLLLWQAPFWFGFIEPTLAVMIVLLVALKYAVFRYWKSTG